MTNYQSYGKPVNLSNPNDTFVNYTNQPYNSFNTAYKSNEPLIDQQRYINKHTTLHDNLNNNLQNQEITEYILNLDSLNRNVALYPNPYKYSVLFNQNEVIRNLNNMTYSGRKYANDNDNIIIDKQYNIPPSIPILKNFRNVKYINVNSVILPNCYNITETSNVKKPYEFDIETNMVNDRFCILKINTELDNNIYSNNVEISRKGIVLVKDKLIGNDFYKAISMSDDVNAYEYKKSALPTLKKIDIEFLNDYYQPINDTGINVNETNICNLNHPLNKYRQNIISLKVGVVENDLNTDVKYSY